MTETRNETTALTVGRRGHTMVVTINRPEARNAVDLAVTEALGDALAAAESDPDVRVVVLTGAGEKSFCAGADLKAIARGENLLPTTGERARWGFAGYASHPISKPTIAAVNGTALGGGLELVLASDLAVAAEHATFGLPEVKRGIIAGAGGVFRLPTQVPRKTAYEMIFTGASVSAREALALGLVNRVVPGERVLQCALELADVIGENAPLAVQASKRVAQQIVDGVAAAETSFWELSARERAVVRESEDAKEGPRAFAEKRKPVWQAR
ncbi:enoyl-CoA hydratase-related protein [Streptomyces griseorubiginosus]|uniref:enoyl-CoA hydratase-related protein n=1 Tax=Streptomyces griseorubiginosus TaxID=67304 RepID=UPI0036823B0D